jgi:sterol 3beta-glucosyltransferase
MTSPQRIMIAAWGSRGDLQPVAALSVKLKQMGREVLVFATPPATDMLIENAVECIIAKENMGDFVLAMFEHLDLSDRSMSGVIKLAKFANRYLNSDSYIATQREDMIAAIDAAKRFSPDLLIVPNILYGPYMSIAEHLEIPVITFDLQINHPTSELPLFTMEVGKVPNFLNRSLYKLKEWIYPRTMKRKFDMMRALCDLPVETYRDGSKFEIWPHALPQICAVSSTLCPQPKDWPEQKIMSGWWILPRDHNYTPPEELIDFLHGKPVCIGFGSMKGNPEFCAKLSTLAITGLYMAETKGLLLGGWAGLTRESLDRSTSQGQKLYEWAQMNVFEIDACPHEWLFPQCAAVVHHGGAGTLAAGIRAGIPSIICATQGDQPFHGSLVKRAGIGKYLGIIGAKALTADALAEGITEVMTDHSIINAAREMSNNVQQEDGVMDAIDFIDKMAMSYIYPWPLKI